MLKGIDPGKFTASSDDDPAIIAKLEAVMKDLKSLVSQRLTE